MPPQCSADDAGHRRSGLWAFDLLNANTWDPAKRYIEKTAADFALVQETKVRGEAIVDAQGAAARMGWQMSFAACDATEAGYPSAGVAVGARAHLGMAVPPIPVIDPIIKSRVHIRWVGNVCKGGLYLVSLYLHNGEGLTQRKLDLLQAVAVILASIKALWMVAADFQNSPEDLARSGWPALVGGVLIAPSEPICLGGTID